MTPDFEKGNGLVPAIVQDITTQQVLMLGYMNAAALEQTQKSGLVTFYSRSKQRLWTKGETSGNTLEVQRIQLDCDNDTLLIQARPNGPTCHTGTNSCFGESSGEGFLYKLQAIIEQRIASADENSYTKSLYESGINKVAQKVGEEAVEVVIEAKDDNLDLFENEAADLLYHLMVLCAAKGTSLERIEKVLAQRQK